MVQLKQMSILFCLVFIVLTTLAQDADDVKRMAEIEVLEKEKNDLYKQINDAIDQSVKHLEETNDTDSKLGISLIFGLKKQLEQLNGTDPTDETYNLNLNDTRRSDLQKVDKDFRDELVSQMHNHKSYRDRYYNRLAMQKRINEWLTKKAEEKLKIKEYLKNKYKDKLENCPSTGYDKKKATKKKLKGNGKGYQGIVPCCRKCCKRSYLGCLKKK